MTSATASHRTPTWLRRLAGLLALTCGAGALAGAATVTAAPTTGAPRTAEFDPTTLCPSATPTPGQLRGVLEGLSLTMRQLSGETGVTSRVRTWERDEPAAGVDRIFRGDPVTGRSASGVFPAGSD